MSIKLLKHQSMFLSSLTLYNKCRYYWFIGGYGSGKSFTIGQTMIKLSIDYAFTNVVIGVGSPTISLMKKTFIMDLEIILKTHGVKYDFNRQDNIFILNGVQFVLVSTGYPADIYAYNFNAFLCDELDELSLQYGKDAFTAIDERCRIPFPDGRPPFCAFYSTAQGYKTIYGIIREFQEKGIQYVLIRGKTKDNFYNDPSYYENRFKLYNENERLAYLEGHFVNLTTGRVYPDFLEETMTVDDFTPEPHETIFVGQDLNDFFNRAVSIVKRDGILYITQDFNITKIGTAPEILRNTFTAQPILYFPDCGGQSRTIIDAYLADFRNLGIQVRMGTVNPNIVERIFIVNKLFKAGLLKVCKRARDVSLALKTRGFNDLGLPEKGKGEKAPDHICDSLEYVIYRIASSDIDFINFMRAVKKEN